MKTLLLTLAALYQKPIAARRKASVEGLEARLTGKVVTMPVRESARNSPFASKWALIRKDLMVFRYINLYSHSSCARNRVSASSTVTRSNRTSSRGRSCPIRERSAEITFAGLG